MLCAWFEHHCSFMMFSVGWKCYCSDGLVCFRGSSVCSWWRKRFCLWYSWSNQENINYGSSQWDAYSANNSNITLQHFHLVLFIFSGEDRGFYRKGFEIWTILGVPPQENFKIEVLGNRISSIIRPNQHVMTIFFISVGLTQLPNEPLGSASVSSASYHNFLLPVQQ